MDEARRQLSVESGKINETFSTSLVSSSLRHIALIMDGNGRWAKSRGLERVQGHRAGSRAVKSVVEACVKYGISYLTLFSFSTENWNREKSEVSALMGLLSEYLDSELPDLMKHNIRLRVIGDITRLPAMLQKALKRTIKLTSANTRLNLVLALNYGAREEIIMATRRISDEVVAGKIVSDDINQDIFSRFLWTGDIPDPDLLIRTSGEMRISNFLLWQLAYTEIVVVPEFWPDFNEEILLRCLDEYKSRERRFGCTSEQIGSKSHKEVGSRFGFNGV
ncbi:MAG TPA: isoprenyl transferase [Oligoflexia bacterium]|nr:isoprenyl transferase [Oligoflexia bacterium]HMP47268.1 isoprenyl transferase [Oligoflexia bacterium]